MTCGFVCDERYFWHDARDAGGPYVEAGAEMETPVSRRRMLNLLSVTGLRQQLTAIEPVPLDREDLLRVHPAEYLDRFKAQSDAGGGTMGDYADFGPGSYEIAVLAAGGVHAAFDAVVTGGVDTAYALVRPPGHHAERDRGRGYCLLANIPLALEKLRAERGTGRVAVIDWDVHHGNGTQSIYWDDPATLAISLHQRQLFPYESGTVGEAGGTPALGRTVNVPLPAGSGVGAYAYAFERIVEPAVRAFRPELIVVASGFDASCLDPMGRMLLTPAGYAALTRRVMALGRELSAPVAFAHEGGYSPVAVPFCGVHVLAELLGADAPVAFGDFGYMDALEDQQLNVHQRGMVDQAQAAAARHGALG
ncbi:class II histone deacetylase [Sediminivirga luteola]|uniref:class II histone deacetylase n=1 Tax=Sediminivirga luteola TaxID=1774748 RepID=UPI001F5A6224|nr:class II histone deacetylase [Sediminivirga luteola]MCI2264344.1 class II histone deacetylase [Sediminivirga luteola]